MPVNPNLNLQAMYRKAKFVLNEMKKPKSEKKMSVNGRMAELMTICKIYKEIGYVGTVESTNASKIDIFAIPGDGRMAVTIIQVKSIFGATHIVHFTPADLEEREGLVWIFVVEVQTDQYAYLVFTHKEIQELVKNLEPYVYPDRPPQYDLTVPKSLKGFEQYHNSWEKIEQNGLTLNKNL